MSESGDRRDTLLATLLVTTLCYLLLMQAKAFHMLFSSCLGSHYYTCFFEKEENFAYSFITSRWTLLCLRQKVILPARLFWTRASLSCPLAKGSHGICPPGLLAAIEPDSTPSQTTKTSYLPTEDQGGRMKYLVINCMWRQHGKNSCGENVDAFWQLL